jgi:hypothetical protein
MKPWIVKVEDQEYDVDAPDEATAWAWANQFHTSRPRTSIGQDIKDLGKGLLRGIPQAGQMMISGVGNIATTGASLLGQKELADSWQSQLNTNARTLNTALDELLPINTVAGKLGQAAGTVPGTLGAIMANPVAGVSQIHGGTMEIMRGLVDQGVDPETAGKATYPQAAVNTLGMLIPQLRVMQNIAVNMGSGAIADEISRQILSEYEASQQYNPKSEDYWVSRFQELLMSAIGAKRTPKQVETNVKANLDAIDAEKAKGEFPTPPDQIPDPNSPDALALAQARTGRPPVINIDSQGFQRTPEAMAAESAIESQRPVGPQFGGIDIEAARQAAARDMSAKTMSLADESQYPVNDGGVRPTGTDGTPLRGMAEDVPTVDFPLRQEVLEQPAIKEAIDNFRVQIADALEKGDQAKVDELTRDFTAGMQRLGIARPEDAFGRALYEPNVRYRTTTVRDLDGKLIDIQTRTGESPARYLETGIRRGGEENPQLQYGDQKQLPLGGKKVTAAEKSTWSDAFNKWRQWRDQNAKGSSTLRRRQGGYIDLDLLTFGVSKLLKNTDPGALVKKFIGTYHPYSLQMAVRESLDPKSRERLVWMAPWQFHYLAKQRGNTDHPISRQKRENVRKALKTDKGLNDVPFLFIDKDGNVVGHEGRHRMDVLHENNLDLIPVRLKFSMLRNEDGAPPFTRLKAEDGFGSLEMPKSIFELDREGRLLNSTDPELKKWLKRDEPEIDYERKAEERARQDKDFEEMTDAEYNDFLRNKVPGMDENATIVTKEQYKAAVKVFGDKPLGDKQRGGAKGTWNPYAVKKAITEAVESAMSVIEKGWPKSTAAYQNDATQRIPGLRDITFVPPDEPLTPQNKQTILSEKDGPGLIGRNITPGRVMIQEFWNSTLVKNVGRAWENARNRWEVTMNNEVRPMKKVLNQIMNRPKEAKILHDIFMRELKNDQRYTEAELRAAGVSQRVLDGYMSMRRNFDAVLDAQNEARKNKKKPKIKALDAYMASRWVGPWQARVEDANGKVIWYISERTAFGRQRAIKWIEKNAPDLRIAETKYDSTFDPKAKNLIAGYQSMVELLGPSDPAVQRIKELMEQLARSETENIAGQEQHFKAKTGKRGFAGDRPWAGRDARDFIQQQLEYIENGYLWAEQQKAVELTKMYTQDPDIMKVQSNNIKYAQELAKAEMGIGTMKEIKAMEDLLGKVTGWNPNAYARGLGISKSLFYMKQLGMNVPFMTISLLQPALVLAPAHLHFGTNFLGALRGAAMDGPAMAMRQLTEDLMALNQFTSGIDMNKIPDFADSLGKEAYEFAKANRVTELNQLSDVRDISMPQSVINLERTVGATISGPELISRSIMYMSFVRGLEPKFDTSTREGRLQLFQKAAEITQFSMGVYEPTQKPLAYQKTGMAGNALFTLQTFIFNQAGQLATYAKDFTNGKPLPLAAYLFSMWTFAGAMGMIGVDDAEELLNTFKRSVPTDLYLKIKDWSIKNFILENMGDTVAYGPVSKITGTNLYTRASMGDVLNLGIFESDSTTMLESYLPFITTMYKDIAAAGTLATNPTDLEAKSAWYQLTPTGGRGLFEEKVPGMKAGTGVLSPTDLKKNPTVRRYPEEESLRRKGFRSLREQQEMDSSFAERTKQTITAKRVGAVSDKLLDSLVSQNMKDVSKYLDQLIELGGDLSSIGTKWSTVEKNRLMTVMEAEATKQPRTITEAKKVARYNELLQKFRP